MVALLMSSLFMRNQRKKLMNCRLLSRNWVEPKWEEQSVNFLKALKGVTSLTKRFCRVKNPNE